MPRPKRVSRRERSKKGREEKRADKHSQRLQRKEGKWGSEKDRKRGKGPEKGKTGAGML